MSARIPPFSAAVLVGLVTGAGWLVMTRSCGLVLPSAWRGAGGGRADVVRSDYAERAAVLRLARTRSEAQGGRFSGVPEGGAGEARPARVAQGGWRAGGARLGRGDPEEVAAIASIVSDRRRASAAKRLRVDCAQLERIDEIALSFNSMGGGPTSSTSSLSDRSVRAPDPDPLTPSPTMR